MKDNTEPNQEQVFPRSFYILTNQPTKKPIALLDHGLYNALYGAEYTCSLTMGTMFLYRAMTFEKNWKRYIPIKQGKP